VAEGAFEIVPAQLAHELRIDLRAWRTPRCALRGTMELLPQFPVTPAPAAPMTTPFGHGLDGLAGSPPAAPFLSAGGF
jgi:hypothetical protein